MKKKFFLFYFIFNYFLIFSNFSKEILFFLNSYKFYYRPHCDITRNPRTCVQCYNDSHCEDPDRPFCDLSTKRCVSCLQDTQCRSDDACDSICVNKASTVFRFPPDDRAAPLLSETARWTYRDFSRPASLEHLVAILHVICFLVLVDV